jgi:hypothetical protein
VNRNLQRGRATCIGAAVQETGQENSSGKPTTLGIEFVVAPCSDVGLSGAWGPSFQPLISNGR